METGISPVMKLHSIDLLLLMEESSRSKVSTNSPKTIILLNIIDTSQLVKLNNQNQEIQLLSKFHHITVSETRSIPLVMFINSLLRSQKLISLSMLITIKRFSDIPLDSTQRSQRTLIEDLLSHSISPMIPFQSSNQPKRTPVSLKVHSSREESTRTLTTTCYSLLQVTSQSAVILRSTVTISTCLDVTTTLPSTSLPTHTNEKTIIRI